MAATLYERLGRSEGIQALVDDVVIAHLENPIIAKRYTPLSEDPERLAQAKEHLCCFLEAGTGGPERYSGRSMPDIHRGMNISGEEYLATVEDIISAMEKRGIDEEARMQILAILYSLRTEIMRL